MIISLAAKGTISGTMYMIVCKLRILIYSEATFTFRRSQHDCVSFRLCYKYHLTYLYLRIPKIRSYIMAYTYRDLLVEVVNMLMFGDKLS